MYISSTLSLTHYATSKHNDAVGQTLLSYCQEVRDETRRKSQRGTNVNRAKKFSSCNNVIIFFFMPALHVRATKLIIGISVLF